MSKLLDLYARALLWLALPAIRLYRQMNSLTVREDGSWVHTGASCKETQRLAHAIFGQRQSASRDPSEVKEAST